MAGLKNINSFKSTNNENIKNAEKFIESAAGETNKIKYGAPKKSDMDKRSQKIIMYFTPGEITKLRDLADERSMKITEFIRFKTFS